MTPDGGLLNRLRAVVGKRHVLTGLRRTARFRNGFWSGEGNALAVVRPGTLLEQCQVLQACVAADKIVILQAASTGLTEGSSPNGTYDCGVVVISTCKMDGILAIDGGQQIISFPGATLFALEKLLKRLGRQPYSVDWFVLHRSFDYRRGLQQLGRVLGRARPVLYRVVALSEETGLRRAGRLRSLLP